MSRPFALCVQNEDIAALTTVSRASDERPPSDSWSRCGTDSGPGRSIRAVSGDCQYARVRIPKPEAFGALVALGYRPAEATRLLKAAGPGTHSTEELIRRALQGAIRRIAGK